VVELKLLILSCLTPLQLGDGEIGTRQHAAVHGGLHFGRLLNEQLRDGQVDGPALVGHKPHAPVVSRDPWSYPRTFVAIRRRLRAEVDGMNARFRRADDSMEAAVLRFFATSGVDDVI